jgi:hypothetical protein
MVKKFIEPPYSPAWQRAANNLARSRTPPIYPCNTCNYPVVDGYCCGYCGNDNPRPAA